MRDGLAKPGPPAAQPGFATPATNHTVKSSRSPSAEQIVAAADQLRRQRPAVTPDALVNAAGSLLDDTALEDELVQSTGLSRPMVRWGLAATVETIDHSALHDLRLSPDANRFDLCGVVLSGNVFTASVRALLLPLLFDIPVVAKASSRDGVLPHALARRLPATACSVFTYPGGDTRLDRALLKRADTVHVYGSDTTCARLRPLATHATFTAHGHGYGLACIDSDDFRPADLALDIAAYDQRGCLSPQQVWVRGDCHRAAQKLHEALRDIEKALPRGPAELGARARIEQWRGTVLSLGSLVAGETHGIGIEESSRLPPSPGWRHVVLRPIPRFPYEALARMGGHLKALAGAELLPRLPEQVAPWLSKIGRMQRPPLSAYLDGLAPADGYRR